MIFLHFYKGEQLFVTSSLFFPRQCSLFNIGFTLKGKNLLLGEQILYFKSWTLMIWEAKIKIYVK